MFNVLMIALGGALGTLARYGTAVVAARWTRFPLGTLTVNLVGCFLIGYLHGLYSAKLLDERWRLPLVVGFLGGFTTFSSFGSDTALMLEAREYGRATLNVLLNNIAGVLLVMAGWAMARPRG